MKGQINTLLSCLRFPRLVCLVSTLVSALVANVRKMHAPKLSFFNLGVLYFSTVSELYSKQASVKCFEHTTAPRIAAHLCLMLLTNFSHFPLHLANMGDSSSQKGISYTEIPSSWLAVFEQPPTTHHLGIFDQKSRKFCLSQ